jgi:hypothetical protein
MKKIKFIELGRLSNPEMRELYGGGFSCKVFTACPGQLSGKGTCTVYTNCDNDGKLVCEGTNSVTFVAPIDPER